MSRVLTITVVVLQLAVLAFMAGKREWILENGRVVYLRTAPVDPRDPMRGDFVRLSYPINTVSLSDWRAKPGRDAPVKGERVFAALRAVRGELYELDYLSPRAPQGGVFLQGRVRYVYDVGAGGYAQVSYGIEQLFVQQGKGLDIEARRGRRDGLQVPMEVAVALSKSGEAQLKDYRWSPLGVQLTTESPGSLAPGLPSRSPVLRFTLKNMSDAPLAVMDSPAHCSLHLIQEEGPGPWFRPADHSCATELLSVGHLVRLEPGQSLGMMVDLNQARWFVRAADDIGHTGSIAELAAGQRFRLEYRSPPRTEAAAATLWHGRLSSPVFSVRGTID